MRNRGEDLDVILAQALAIESDEQRYAFLKQACGDDADKLADMLRRLDFSSADVPSSAQNAAHDETVVMGASSTTFESPGSEIGQYRLLRKLGEGGFGVVYQAEQLWPVRRDVALKIIKVGMDTRQVIVRFRAESQALALMEHPGIAKVLDAGATEQGRPYFVMELVKGIPITAYCDQHRLTAQQRLELFMSVCRAIHHAHEKGVVHRDIKPSNVLVTTQDGAPAARIIDFGIAKATAQPLADVTVHTGANQLLGTPKYMSPEQAEGGGNIDGRSDIYALGVLLYELLTGSTPFVASEDKSPLRDELRRMILQEEPQRPSTYISLLGQAGTAVAESRQTDVRSLRGCLRGDLDWIILRCLEKKPERRYDTAEQLADDVLRHLQRLPVLAGPPTWTYRIRKYCQRRRGPLLATTIVGVAIALTAIASLWFVSNARQRAREVQFLAEVQTLKDLVSEQPSLVAVPYGRRLSAMWRWEGQAVKLALRLDEHRAALERLRQQSEGFDASGSTASPADQTSGWRFADARIQDQHDALEKYVADLETLVAPQGLLAKTRQWIQRIPERRDVLERWQAYEASPTRYVDATLPLQERLVPLAQNPASGLWEFADVSLGLLPVMDDAGNVLMSDDTGLVFVLLPGGQFTMGSPDDESNRIAEAEHPHTVSVSPLLISKFEVTQAQWRRAMGDNPAKFRNPLHPVESLSWELCQVFCRDQEYSLPSEAQWEYACRGGVATAYGGSGDLSEMGWYRDNSDMTTHPVGLKAANHFGLFDMHGNVLEWCLDVYQPEFFAQPAASTLDPLNLGPPSATDDASPAALPHVLRGGSFEGRSEYCRAANRYHEYPGIPYYGFGLRPVLPIKAATPEETP